MSKQLQLFDPPDTFEHLSHEEFILDIESFCEFNQETAVLEFPDKRFDIPVYVNEFWTSKQRAANPVHEISYRACFKPQLPRFFISRLTSPGDAVYDPFLGRGTTAVEAALLGRTPVGNDINPLSKILVRPRLSPPTLSDISNRLDALSLDSECAVWDDLLVFYHPNTLRQITNLRNHFLKRQEKIDLIDEWIRMVATNRLTGHSVGFFSVYSMPPNQAVSIERQKKINEKRDQIPPERDVKKLIVKKSQSLLRKVDSETLPGSTPDALLITGSADDTPTIPGESISLVVTSPPFLDIVDYQSDNWLRCWFTGIDSSDINIWQLNKPERWQAAMRRTFIELKRVLKPGGYIAFEVGEVRNGKILLENLVVPAAYEAGLEPLLVMINAQNFTKTSNCWGVDNGKKGTNTNRIVLIRKP